MDIVTLALAKKYANKKIAELAAVGFAPKIMDSLPTENINEHTLYLVPASDGINSNGYLEYIYINGNWECVGSTIIDFSMIGDVSQLTTEDKSTLVAAINEIVENYVSNTALNTAVNNMMQNISETYETKENINNHINTINQNINIITNDYSTKTYVDEKINARVFQGNITTFNNLTEKEQKAFDIAVVEPLATLADEEILLVNSMVGGEETETIVDMSENEIHNALDNIIGGE